MKIHILIYIFFSLLPYTTNASEVYKPCDADQGFHFQPDQKSRIGYITHIQIDDMDPLTPDLMVYDPQDPSKQIPVFAVLRIASWGLQPSTPIFFLGQISPTNQHTIHLAKKQNLTKTNLQFQFVIYDYNPQTQLYYKSFHSNQTEMRGQIELQDDNLSLSVENKPWPRLSNPENYTFSISILPTALMQHLYLSLTPNKDILRPWQTKTNY